MTFFALQDRALARLFAFLTILTLVVSLLPMQAFAFGDDHNNGHDNDWKPPETKVTICHYDRGQGGKYTSNTVSVNAFGLLDAGHSLHANDIIPSYEWTDFFHNTHTVNGKNWDDEGQAIWNAGCTNRGDVTVTKVVEGTTTVDASDFDLKLGETAVTSGVQKEDVLMGDYTVTETAHEGISTDYTASYSEGCPNGEIKLEAGADVACTITNTYNPPAPTTGSLVITKYECPADTSVTRNTNGVNGTVPNGCSLESGATFGYVHGDATNADAPFPELPLNGGVITEAGVTDGSGVLTVPNLASDGRYLVVETDGSGTQLPADAILGLFCAGDGDTSGQNDNQELTFIPAGQSVNCVAYNKMKAEPTTPVATVTATKLVCTDEADLPNWGNGGPDITATTAAEWVADHHSCSVQPNWQFEWAHADIADPRDTVTTGSAGAGWTSFDAPTDANGQATIDLSADDLNGDSTLWVREDLQNGYIPFTWSDNHDNSNPVSAEIYCSTDVLNYDNWDKVENVAVGNSYNCVAWNVSVVPQQAPACENGDNLLSDGSFESPVGTNGSGWDIAASGASGLSWIVSWVSSFVNAPATANIELHHGVYGWLASNGSQYAELDSDWGGPTSGQTGEEASTRISQTVTTEPGATYELKYDFSARPNTGTSDNLLNVYVGGTLADTQSADGMSLPNQTSWTSYAKDFVATSSNTEIAFADGGTPNSLGTLLDNAALCKVKDAPKVPSVTINATKVVCNTEAELPNGDIDKPITAETAQDWVDQSDGTCHLASDWSFEWGPSGAGDGGAATIGHAANYNTFGPTGTDGVVTTNVPLEGLNGRIEAREVLQDGYVPFTNNANDNVSAEFYCANDAAGYDNWEWIQNPQDGQTYNCVAFNAPVVAPAPICEIESEGSGADAVVSFDQGSTLNPVGDVSSSRSHPEDALNDSNWSSGDTNGFVSLGFGGTIVLSFNSYVPNVVGADLHVHEATNGVYPLERADVYVSQDGVTWELAGVADNTAVGDVTDIDFNSTGYAWIKYVKLVDTSPELGQNANADGFDLDAVVATQQVCDEPAVQMCTLHIVSSTQDQSDEADGNAALVAEPHHVNWTAIVGDGAKWIWSMDPITDPVGTTSDTFTKSFTWNGSVDSATLTVAADNSYTAKVNSTVAASNASEFNYFASTQHDVKSLIQNGTNNLSFDVTNWSLTGGTPQTNPGGLIYDLTITGENADCATDGVVPPDDNGGGDHPARHTLSITTTGDGDGVITSSDEGTAIDCDSAADPEETTCTATFDEGTHVDLHVTPNDDSNFDHSWAVEAGTCTGNNASCSVTMSSDVNLTAHFDLNDTDVVQNDTNGGGNGKTLSLLNDDQFGVGGGDTYLPTGQVLGASTSTMPIGAPNTGAGGTSSDNSSTFPSFITLLSMLLFVFGASALRRV